MGRQVYSRVLSIVASGGRSELNIVRAILRASDPREPSVGTIPRLACVTVSRSRKSSQSMMASVSENWVLWAQASEMRKGVLGSANSISKRFVSNADGLRRAGVVLSLCGVAVVAAETVFLRRSVYAGELTLGRFFCRRRFSTRSAFNASGVDAAGFGLVVAFTLRFLRSRLMSLVGFCSVLRCSLLFRRGSSAGT